MAILLEQINPMKMQKLGRKAKGSAYKNVIHRIINNMLPSKYVMLTLSPLATVVLAANSLNMADAATKFNGIKIAGLKQNNQNYIGLRYQDKPRGLKDLGGWIVGDPNASRVYGISHIVKQNQEMLWFEIIFTDSQGKLNFQVIDVLNLPKLSKSEGVLGGQSSVCLLRGVRDQEITVIAKYQDTQYLRQIKKAWRANRKSNKFEGISTRNIACENPAWGL